MQSMEEGPEDVAFSLPLPAHPRRPILRSLSSYLFESPDLSHSMQSFVDSYCAHFSMIPAEAATIESATDQKIEWTYIHQSFCGLLEQQVATFLVSNSFSQEDFLRECASTTQGEDESEICEWLLCFMDYKVFVSMMVERAKSLE